jgi:hypothetical protein
VNLPVEISVWSLFLRRQKRNEEDPYVIRLCYHPENEDCIHLTGPILQELLDGVREQKQFDLLREYFDSFPQAEPCRGDFFEAS